MAAAPSPSPRPSLSLLRSPTSSSRTSLDVPISGQNSLSRGSNTRRNRAALRDYYGLKASTVEDGTEPQGASSERTPNEQHQSSLAELDRDGFEAGAYVRGLLEREGLEGVLSVENELVGEIRGLDGERKALVYDNYSKLIAATDTIRKMRTNMDPLTPTTSTLSPAISHIAETAVTLSNELANHVPPPKDPEIEVKRKQRQTVRWVLDAPGRLQQLIDEGKHDEANREWDVVGGLLDKWKGVPGVSDVWKACEGAMTSVNE